MKSDFFSYFMPRSGKLNCFETMENFYFHHVNCNCFREFFPKNWWKSWKLFCHAWTRGGTMRLMEKVLSLQLNEISNFLFSLSSANFGQFMRKTSCAKRHFSQTIVKRNFSSRIYKKDPSTLKDHLRRHYCVLNFFSIIIRS
jgi:hypothetical protein